MDKTWKNLTINLVKSIELKAELIQTDTAGRGLVATQDLSKNDVLFTETPFVVGPTQSVGPHFCANCSQALNVGVLQGKQTQVMTLKKLCKLAREGKGDGDNIRVACSMFTYKYVVSKIPHFKALS